MLHLPQSLTTGEDSVTDNKNVVVIGANGSGKSRLGVWIDLESPEAASVHRISAQKLLQMPDSAQPKSLSEAEGDLLYGRQNAMEQANNEQQLVNYKKGRRWSNSPVTNHLNDFRKLLTYLASDHYAKAQSISQKVRNLTNE